MRIATWNCFSGECRDRAAHPGLQEPDIVVLQECSRPTQPPTAQCHFFGPTARGVGIVSRGPWTLEEGPTDPDLRWVYPVRVRGPRRFNLLAVWAHPEPNGCYVQCVHAGLTRYDAFLREPLDWIA